MKNFAGSGWVPHRSTLLNIKTAAAELVQPLVKFFADEVRKDDVVGTDDTGVTLLLPKILPAIVPNDVRSQRIHEVLSAAFKDNKKHVKAKMWAYRGSSVPLNIFERLSENWIVVVRSANQRISNAANFSISHIKTLVRGANQDFSDSL